MTPLMPWERVDGKVTGRHRDALAVVYVRQSTRQQVVEHGESTRLQYALVDRAAALGWQASRIVVIDEDLGRSGTSAVARPGFQRLVSEVSLGHVGLVLGIEMSRLARSGKDFYQLLELCALSGTLLADTDGVYDPGEVNDRMLLGLKGTMSEVELHLIKQRMQAGKVSKARRGELGFALPMGYVRRPSGEPVLDPDEQVRSAVRLVFDTFAELGTLNGALRYLVTNGIDLPLRARSGPDKGELVWRRPNRATLQWMLHSPIYAGSYAYGRRRVDPRRKVAGRPSTGKVVVDPDQWIVMIPGALPAYISEQTWRDNLARLAANASKADTTGAARRGSALLSGLVHCGRCGKRMSVRYHVREGHRQADYACARELTDYGGRLCQAMAGTGIDAYVTAQVLAALAPAAIEVSLHAADQVEADRARVDRIWHQRLERASIDVERARRCYRLAEPENRLVVRQLEHEWEQALAARLVRPSFVPPQPIRELRDTTRYRTEVVRERTREIQRLDKLLEDAGIKLSSVVSDIVGKSGRAMLEALVAGERDPLVLAELALRRMRGKRRDPRPGAHRPLHRPPRVPGPRDARPHRRLHRDGDPPDSRRPPTWPPGQVSAQANESAGKHGTGKTRHGDPWLKGILGQVASSASRSRGTYLNARYRRIASRRGKKRALVALEHTILIAVWHMFTHDTNYHDLGGDYFIERTGKTRQTRRLVSQLTQLGYQVTLQPTEAT